MLGAIGPCRTRKSSALSDSENAMSTDLNQPSDSTPESMISEGGAIRQPSVPPVVPLTHRIEATANRLRWDTQNYLHNHPWRNVAIAFGVGLVIGAVVARETEPTPSSRWF